MSKKVITEIAKVQELLMKPKLKEKYYDHRRS